MGKKVIDKRAESIVLQEITRQKNLVAWYKAMDAKLCSEATEKIEKLEQQLIKIRED